jgi:AraC-like DNA-binding protein
MLFEFVTSPDFNFLNSFAKKLNVQVENNTLPIPDSLGQGKIRNINLFPDFKLIIHRYKLNEEFVLKRMRSQHHNDMISIIFNCNEVPVSHSTEENEIQFTKNNSFAIQIASTDLNSISRFPANAEIDYVVVVASVSKLKTLLNINKPNCAVQTILSGNSGFLFYERMCCDVEKKLMHLKVSQTENELTSFYYKIKVEELLYLVFEKLLKRETKMYSPVNEADIDKLFLVRSAVLSDLSMPPRLKHLAEMSCLSETKMKNLFKQVFGEGIFSYFQKARMEEAAFLLKRGGCSVSETGFRLGFINLSHFTRLFEKQYGVNPKKYSYG